MSKLARNERRKLLANFLNNLAVASMLLGWITPLAAGLELTGKFWLFAGLSWLLAFILHGAGHYFLNKLEE